MLQKILVIFLTLTLSITTVGCGSSNSTQNKGTFSNNTSIPSNNISTGKYPVQQATYNDVDGEYTLMLLNTPAGSPPTFRSTNLQMARLTDEEIKNGEKTYLNVNGKDTAMHLSEDFRIEYVHNVTETRNNQNTGQPETIVVRQQSSFWSPFAGAMAGQALGSLLFRPQYYVPPVYSGGIMTGYGGYGSTYNQAVSSYQSTYKSPPPAVQNRNTFRTTGSLRNSSTNSNNTSTKRKNSSTNSNTKATGSGFGSSNLKTKGKSSTTRKPSNSSFGTKKTYNRKPSRTPARRSSGFGSRRRR